ncbi:MAG: hypothetical protein WAT12_10275 [Candidatus Nitrotoga sp.]
MSKESELEDLVKLRKASRWEGYGCIGDYQNGLFECDFVSPYTLILSQSFRWTRGAFFANLFSC